MRNAAFIMDLWQRGGPFEGVDGRANTIVTVQDPWTGDPAVAAGDEDHVIHPTTSAGNAVARGIPIRWYQKEDNSQTERVIPNVKMVTIDRSIEADAATCTITISNQWMYDNGTVPADRLAEGNRQLSGFFTPERGAYPDATARWGHEVNEWAGVFVPNALLRTYQGYGGHGKTLAQALADGNVILSGVWLVDEVNITAEGNMEINCRDMAKLLIEQQLFPPLVPADHYPLTYYRWTYDNFAVSASNQNVTVSNTINVPVGNKRAVYRDSSVDRWYGAGTVLHGHRGTDTLDGNVQTYWLGEGNSGPDRAFATSWIEYDCGEAMNAVYVHPWAGNYTMYVSVMVNGRWQGSATVPYDPSELYATQTVVNTGANIPYVKSFGVSWESGQTYVLPDTYVADRVRISFRHLAYSGIGSWYYRAGVREFRIRADASATGSTTNTTWTLNPILFAADTHPVSGYVTITNLWQIDAFGDAREQLPDGALSTSVSPVAVSMTPSGNGYYALDQAGTILAFGDATHLGDPKRSGFNYSQLNNGMTGMDVTPSGNGYWVIGGSTGTGVIYAYGDAVSYGSPAPTGDSTLQQIKSTPSGDGYWIMDTNGVVSDFGDAVNYGSYSETSLDHAAFSGSAAGDLQQEGANSFAPTSTGNGYWIMTNTGRIQNFGDADDFGGPIPISASTMNLFTVFSVLLPSPEDTGYLVGRGNGFITPFGDADSYGGPVVGSTGQIRLPGNYADYADIIKDLALWSGFLLYDGGLAGNEAPAVYGNIETTGAYAREKLPDEIFDKRPVIDAMTEIKEVVGYLLFVDDEGGLRFECVDEETEILTRRGWLRHDALKEGDYALAYNRDARCSVWEPVERVNRYVVEDQPMVSFESRSHSSLTTPNHRWWVESARGRPGQWRRSDEIAYDDRIPIAAPHDGPIESQYLDEFAELVGWWISEGSRRATGGYICQSRIVNPINCERIERCFEKVYGPANRYRGGGWAPHRYPSRDRDIVWSFGRNVLDDLESAAPGRVLSMDFLLGLTHTQLVLLIDAAMAGDGHRQMVGAYGPYGRYTQKDEMAVRSLEIACVLAGVAPRTVHKADRNVFRTSFLRTTRIGPRAAANAADGSAAITDEVYTGTVWCPTLLDHNVWLARRNGTVYFTGNSPNFWSMGNFLQETGVRVNQVPEIDERLNLFKFGASRNDDSLRSLIIISSEDPTDAGDTTVTTTLIPQTAAGLRGILKPAMWVNGWFQNEDEQKIMAELISMHIWFAQRVGQVTCVANPAIQINDQVRIYERQTSEVFLHYVRGINTTHDLDTGDYSMTLTTHWLGTGDDWAITTDSSFFGDETHFVISQETMDFVNQADNAISVDDTTREPILPVDPLGPSGSPSAGQGSVT